MYSRSKPSIAIVAVVCALTGLAAPGRTCETFAREQKQADPLPSWNDGKTKQSILDFVAKVTKENSLDFVPVVERIATFDNDGTLWCEKPLPFQFFFALDRVKAIASKHPHPLQKLDKGLDEAKAKGWAVASMKNDWKIIYAYEKSPQQGLK